MSDTPNTPQPPETQVVEAEWDHEQVKTLFDDLEQGAEVQSVRARTRQQDRAVSLSEAKQLVEQGEAKAIQIRYHFDNQDWCDTLMVGPESIRIIRTTFASSSDKPQ